MPPCAAQRLQIEAEVVDAMRASDCGCTCDALLKCTRFAEEELRHLYASPPAVRRTVPRGATLSATWRLRGCACHVAPGGTGWSCAQLSAVCATLARACVRLPAAARRNPAAAAAAVSGAA